MGEAQDRQRKTIKDKRDVILEFYSRPDAILNALHQAGWQVIPRDKPTDDPVLQSAIDQSQRA